jgi:nitrogen fixation NifU-like protein
MHGETSDFWQTHSIKYLEMAFRTDKQEIISQPDGYGKKTGDCGDTIELFITANGDTLENMSFHVNGCMNTAACANTVIQLAEGRTVDQAWDISPETVFAYLETLPDDHFHCAELAIGALYLALSDLQENRRSPWKKAYRKF